MTSDITQVQPGSADSQSGNTRSLAVGTRIKGTDSASVEGAGRSRTLSRVPATTGAASGQSAATEGAESVHITSAAHQLLALQKQIDDAPVVNVARVEQLRSDINQNRYQPDASKIADRLLQSERDLQAAADNQSGSDQ